jgi:hypothetical protein
MAIQDYVRSIAASETVSKREVFRFLEIQFARAYGIHDGALDAGELTPFVLAVARPGGSAVAWNARGLRPTLS